MPPPSSAFEAGLHSLVVGGLMLLFGFMITGLFVRRFELTPASRLALSVPALLAYVTVVMVLHMATGGEVLSRPGLLRLMTGVVAGTLSIGALLRRRSHTERRPTRDALIALGLVVVAIAVWSLPVFADLPLNFSGDIKRHTAWAAQLSSGHTTPTSVITGDVPNYYPWLFHALGSFIAAFTPGGRVLHALGSLQILASAGAVLAFFGAGRVLFNRTIAASSCAVLGALSGGFGFLLTQRPAIELNPRAGGGGTTLEFHGDFMFVRSYNLAFHNLAPPFPRDFGFVLLVAVVMLLALGVRQKRWQPFAGAGCALGMIGLLTGEAFIVGALFAAVLVASGPAIPRVKAAVALFGPMIAVYSLWAVPIAINYARLGGFADTSGDPVTLPPLMVLFSWGIAPPLAVVAVFAWRQWSGASTRVVLTLAVAAVVALIGTGAAPALGEGFTTLGRDHRYWPLLYLAIALCGGYGADVLLTRVARVHRMLAAAVATLLMASAVASPLLASMALPNAQPDNETLTAALSGEASNVLNVLAGSGDGMCEVAVPGPLSRIVPSYSGARLVYFPSDTRNQAGIRWPEIPDQIPDTVRSRDNATLIHGGDSDEQWLSAVKRYGVDRVVVPASRPLPAVMSGYPRSVAEAGDVPYLVVRTGPCVTAPASPR